MDPTSTPPWRALEAPGDDDRPTATPAPDGGSTPWRDPAVLKVVGVVCLAAVVALAAFWLAATSGSGSGVAIDVAPSSSASSEPGTGAAGGEVVVEIVGAVARPGVVRLPAGSRVADLIAAAGGYGPRVDTVRAAIDLHLATVLADGDRIVVPSRDDPVGSEASAATGNAGGDLIDLNTATLERLDTLPGIGPVTAQKILDARAEAPFAAIDELRSRGVLGEKTFEQIRELVTVS